MIPPFEEGGGAKVPFGPEATGAAVRIEEVEVEEAEGVETSLLEEAVGTKEERGRVSEEVEKKEVEERIARHSPLRA